MSKYVKKLTKPVSKVLDKIIPNEIKPFLPYVAAAVPFLAPASFGAGAGLGGLLKRGLLTGALPNTIAQLAQEGNEGELNMLSTLMATGAGAMTAGGAGDTLRGMMSKGKAVPIPRGSVPGMSGGFKYDTSGLTGLDKAKNFLLKGGAKVADAAGGARDVLQNPFEDKVALSDIGKAAAFPVSQATGDVAYAEGVRALKEFNAAEAAKQVAEAAQKAGMDQEYIDAITSSMTAYGYDQSDINEILAQEGLLANGGRVGFAMGGGDFSAPDFMTMGEVIENVNDDEMQEGIMEIARGKNRVKQLYEQIEAGVNVDESMAELFQNYGIDLYNNRANGGRVGFAMGGGDFSAPDFISMSELVENIGGDEMSEGIMQMADLDEGKQFLLNKKYLELLRDYTERGLPDADSRALIEANKFVKEIKLANGGSVLPQGMEMDYRGGGMIPMGSAERADDVPARVSKNEFVMTADAVRGAGGGNVNEGAKRMYNLMNNLEARA